MSNIAVNIYPFSDSTKQKRFHQLINELRCLVCQNQSLADSNAGLANDLKSIIYKQVQQGKSSHEITGYLVDRYGDYVSFHPPVKQTTAVLWFLPWVVLLLGFIVVFRLAKRKR